MVNLAIKNVSNARIVTVVNDLMHKFVDFFINVESKRQNLGAVFQKLGPRRPFCFTFVVLMDLR